MTGPEHYREAERLAADAEKFLDPCDAPSLAQTAQVHASLARTAAYVMSQPVRGMADEPGLEQEEMDGWYAAVNGLPPEARKPAEEYPGELEHLRTLLSAVRRAAPQSDASHPLVEILIDHYSDARIVEHGLSLTDGQAQSAEGGAR